MKKNIMLVIAVALLIASQAGAQSIKLGPQVGYQEAKDADNGKLMAGAALRLKLSSMLGIEGAINYRGEKYSDGALTVRSWPVQASALIYPLPLVHGTIGTGWYNTTLDYDQSKAGYANLDDETTQKIGWHFGGGIDLPVGKSSTLTADIRYVFLDYNFDALPGSANLDSDFYMISVGLLLGL